MTKEWVFVDVRQEWVFVDVRQERVFVDVRQERVRQDAQWGGPAHGDDHEPEAWFEFIYKQLQAAERIIGTEGGDAALYARVIKIAALAVALGEVLLRAHPEWAPDHPRHRPRPAL